MPPDHPQLDTLSIIAHVFADVHERVTRLMAELDPDELPTDLTVGMNEIGRALVDFQPVVERHARFYGYQGPKP